MQAYIFSDVQITLILLGVKGVPLLGVYNQNTEGENCEFQARQKKISQTVSNTAKFTVNSTINNTKSHAFDMLQIFSLISRQERHLDSLVYTQNIFHIVETKL